MLGQKTYVDSSMVTALDYDADNAILEIEFKSNGSVWQYYDVPQYVYDEMVSAESVGKYFHANIKGQYREARV